MKELKKPDKLNPGDKIAAVSLSWGGAGDENIKWRYFQAKERIEKLLGLEVVEMQYTLADPDFVYNHPEARASDFMAAFADKSIKAIFACIGGDDTIRMLPFINYNIINNNPKIFMGYSDTTVNHFMCYKAGISSFYGPCVLMDLAENIAVPEYTLDNLRKALFNNTPAGQILPPEVWSSERLEWIAENKNTPRKFLPNGKYELLQGNGVASGYLTGGCFEVFDWLRGTELFPGINDFDRAILFLETSEEMPPPENIRYTLRAFGAMGILNKINGIIIGKPYHEKYYQEYKSEYIRVLREYGRSDLPVLYNLSFGHCEPKFCLPYGAKAQINCDEVSFAILESGVV